MNGYIQTLHADLTKCEELMRSLLLPTSNYEQLLALYLIHKKHQHTNVLIDYADGVLKSGQGLDPLLNDAKALNEQVTKCYQLYRDNQQVFDSIDNDSLFTAHIKLFDKHHAKVDKLHEVWHQNVKCCAVALVFKLEDLSLVFFYQQRITRSIIDTFTKAQGE